jgi:hypothetical protein
MSAFTLDGRVRLSIALALADRGRNPARPPDREAEARRLGMCGAEIDAARQGRSFDARTSRALALAMAAVARDRDRHHAERARAVRSGIPDAVCRAIEGFAEACVASRNRREGRGVRRRGRGEAGPSRNGPIRHGAATRSPGQL